MGKLIEGMHVHIKINNEFKQRELQPKNMKVNNQSTQNIGATGEERKRERKSMERGVTQKGKMYTVIHWQGTTFHLRKKENENNKE